MADMTVDAALAAMDAAEQEARKLAHDAHCLAGLLLSEMERVGVWAGDRLRLIARDRATLERHADDGMWRGDEPDAPKFCVDHLCLHGWPCPDARAVIDYWQEGA